MSNAHQYQPRQQAGTPTGGQFAHKELADADATPLGSRAKGTAELGWLGHGHEPRNELERAMVRADRFVERAQERANALHRVALVGRVAEAYPDLASLELDIDEETGTLRVLDGRDATGEPYDESAADEISNVLWDQTGFLPEWREQAEAAGSSMTGAPAAVSIAAELENAPAVPVPGTPDAAAARAEDIVSDYHAIYGEGADEETAARDMLTDLYHLCRQKGWDFDSLTQRAASTAYEEEQETY